MRIAILTTSKKSVKKGTVEPLIISEAERVALVADILLEIILSELSEQEVSS
jgi:hypothetical protein